MIARRLHVALWFGCSAIAGCDTPDPALQPDAQLVEELGLTQADRVHTVGLRTEDRERPLPDSTRVWVGDYLQFVSEDWLIHEVRFDSTRSSRDGWAFLASTGQTASPPLLQKGSRFIVSFVGAPPGTYPFRLEGNRGPGVGIIVVAPPSGIP